MARTDWWTDRRRQAAELHHYVDEPQIYRIDHSNVPLDIEFAKKGGEEASRTMQPLLDAPFVHPSAKASWRPAAADEETADNGGWYGPWIES